MRAIKIPVEKIDLAAKIIAEFIKSKQAKLAIPAPLLQAEQTNAIEAEQTPMEAPLTEAEQAEIEAEINAETLQAEQQAETAPLRLHGMRMLAAIHREELKAFNERHTAEFVEYRTAGDKFIPWTVESENLAANARAVHTQAPELWEQPLTKSRKRKRADQTAAATYRD